MLNSVILAQPAMQQAFAGIAPGGIALRGGIALGGIAPAKLAARAAGPSSSRGESESFGFRLAEQTRPDASLLSREPVRYLAAREDRDSRRAFSASSAESSTARRAAEPRDGAAGLAKAGGPQAAGAQTHRAQSAGAQTREAQTREAKTRGDRGNRREASPRDEEREPRTGGVDRASAGGANAVDADRRLLPRKSLAAGSTPVSGSQEHSASRPSAAQPQGARQDTTAEGDQEYTSGSSGGETANLEARVDAARAAIVDLGIHFGGILSHDASGVGSELPAADSGFEAAGGQPGPSTEEGAGGPGRGDPAAWESGGEGAKNRILPFVPRETINQTLNPYMSPVQPDAANVLPNTHAPVETAGDALGSAAQHVSRSFYVEKTNPLDLGADAGTEDPQKFPQGVTQALTGTGEGGEALRSAGREALGPMDPVGGDWSESAAVSTAEPDTPAAGFDPGVLEVESQSGTAGDGDPVRRAGRSSGRASSERALSGQDAAGQDADAAESASPAADADRQVAAAWQAAAASAASDPTAMLFGRWSNVSGQAAGQAAGSGGPGGSPENAAATNSESAPTDGRLRGLGSEQSVPTAAGSDLPVTELERTALRLQIASPNPRQAGSHDQEDPPNQTYRSISSTLASARLYGKIPANTAVGSGAEANSAGRKQAEAAQSLAAIANSAYRSQLRPAGDVFRLPGAESAFEPLRPPASPDGGTVTQGTVLSPHASRPLSALTPGASAGASAGASTGSGGSPGASEAESAAESASRFVRAAALANASGAQRLQVLLQDDQLGRISLRMVDRAGLIQAVVRTDGARAAQLISESLPVLLESLAQRGLPASWTSSQGQSQEQPSDPRQGQPRRQRQPGGQGSGPGGRRPQSSEPMFRVEVR